MSAGSPGRDKDKDFRLLFEENSKTYKIQRKRLLFGWKTLDYSFAEYEYPKARRILMMLRKENKKQRIKKTYIVMED